MISGAPRTTREATEPAYMPASKPMLSAMRAEAGSKTEAGRIQRLPARRELRRRAGVASQLDSIPGVGPARRKALLKAFGSLDAIRAASVEQVAAVPGIPRTIAEAVKEVL